jgi:hypothetical protein
MVFLLRAKAGSESILLHLIWWYTDIFNFIIYILLLGCLVRCWFHDLSSFLLTFGWSLFFYSWLTISLYWFYCVFYWLFDIDGNSICFLFRDFWNFILSLFLFVAHLCLMCLCHYLKWILFLNNNLFFLGTFMLINIWNNHENFFELLLAFMKSFWYFEAAIHILW